MVLRARGDATEDSDVDLMIVEKNVTNRIDEMVRLNRLVRSLDLAVDLLVVSAEKFDYWRETPGNVYFEAAAEGRILYEALSTGAAVGINPISTLGEVPEA